MQQLRFLFATALHVSGDNLTHHQDYSAVYGHYIGEISPTRCNNCVFYSQWLYSTGFG